MTSDSSSLHRLLQPQGAEAWLLEGSQALGALIAANGFADTVPVLHTPRGSCLYPRGHPPHYLPLPAPAEFIGENRKDLGPQQENNLREAVMQALADHAPGLIAIATVCAEQSLAMGTNGWRKLVGQTGADGTKICLSQTPAFTGSHLDGYDNQLHAILRTLWEGEAGRGGQPEAAARRSLNFIGGIDGAAPGNLSELRHILDMMQVDYTVLGEGAGLQADGPPCGTGEGTSLERAAQAALATASISMQAFCTQNTLSFLARQGQEVLPLHYPLGVGATDGLLMAISRLSGHPVPNSLQYERGRLVDAIADGTTHIHGKSFAVCGDPDFCLGMAGFLLELGAEPRHVVSASGCGAWMDKVKTLLKFSPLGQNSRVYAGKDLGFLRLLLLTEPVDFLIGDAGCKFLEFDTGTPLVSLAASPLHASQSRHDALWGYRGGLNVLNKILERVFQDMDRFSKIPSKTDYSFDIIR